MPVSQVADSTDAIARQLLWKVPGRAQLQDAALTRMGEVLFRNMRLRGLEKFLHGPGNGLRRAMLNSIGSVSVRQFELEQVRWFRTAKWRTAKVASARPRGVHTARKGPA